MPPQNDNVIQQVENDDNSIKLGKILANPAPGEEVVISGLSGHYPESENVHKFRDNLFNKVDMVSGDDRRWKPGHPEIPQRTGKIPDIELFDAGYFGIHHRQATQMDPMGRVFLEVVTEAILDAGLHPSELVGTNTGVFVGACFSETEKTWFTDKLLPQGFAITGNERSMLAHRTSQFLKLKGPSFICDTACSSSLYALENAYKALRLGQCDVAIVGGTSLCLHPFVSLQFARLGVLSADGACKAFDKSGNGYARSEAVSAIVLQKSKDAKRIYSTILHAKTNCDGYKNSGITYPSGEMQVKLLKEFYRECDSVKPSELSFLEAHGTGTKVGDPEELQAIDEVFMKDRPTPLMIGSIKSNIGHTEPSSGLCSITKAIIAAETGYIPPNIHFQTCRPGIKGLEEGRLKVVTEKTPFNDNRGLLGVNSFGFGGGNCHVLLKHHLKEKSNGGRPKDNLPRLVCVSGRTKEAIDLLLDDVVANNIDAEHIRLLQEIFRKNIIGHLFRGYSLVSKSGEVLRSVKRSEKLTSNLVLCFGIIDEETSNRAKEFLELPVAASTLQRIHEVLGPKGLNILNILSISKCTTVLEKVIANFTLQLVFANLIKACDIVPDKTFGITKGLALGNLVCAYFDGALTLQEATECAYQVASAAHIVSCSECIDTAELSDLIDQSGTVATSLRKSLATILKKPRELTKRVIFDEALPEISSAYLSKCFGNTKVLEKVKAVLDKNWTLFEIGNGEFGEILSKELEYTTNEMFIKCHGGLKEVLSSIGSLYEADFNPQIQNIYPKVEFPVSRGTPMISPKIKWSHDRKWWVTSYDCEAEDYEEKTTSLVTNDPGFSFMKGHVIDGRNLLPATGYLLLVWETLAEIRGLMISDMKVIFECCRFKRATPLPKEGTRMELIVMIQRGSGNFEVIEGGVPVVSGKIHHLLKENLVLDDLPMPCGVHKDRAPYLSKKDVYKELRLRGYNYSGLFKGINSCDTSAEVSNILWDGNWITFMDNMLQMKILQEDTRQLYVPTSIQRLVIDGKRHIEYARTISEENPLLPCYASRETGIIRSGGIEIRGLNASSIARRKYLAEPVIEKYVFVPNQTSLKTEHAIRVNLQILLENIPNIKVKVVELMDEATSTEVQPLAEIIFDVLGDQPLVQPDITILSKTEVEVRSVKVEDKKLLTETECSLVVGSKILQRSNILQLAFGSIKENGFILSREPLDFENDKFVNNEISITTVFTNEQEKLVLFRKTVEATASTIKISAKDEEFSWVPEVQNLIAKNGNVVAYSQGEPLNGILGLVSCIRREPGGKNVRLVFIPEPDSAPEFDSTLPFYSKQLNKNLAFNVYKDRQWGTYRHMLLDQANQIESEHCYLNSLSTGILSSLTWLEGPLKIDKVMDPEQTLVHINYAAINFRDIMTAAGKINVDSITRDRREQECVQGFEFAGVTDGGVRVMGMVANGACASLIAADSMLLWKVPEKWSLQEAVTCPVVYATSIIGLINKARMKRRDTVLIHSGTGGVGLAAIQIALYMGCTVYTTVGTPEKRAFLKERFPQLKDRNISNSRTTEFEEHVMRETNGRGVDIVLNSLSEEKLLASVRCLARGGRFIEIGKFDLANDNTLNLLFLEKGASFHGVMIDAIMKESPKKRAVLYDTIQEFLDYGALRPLPKTLFKMNEAEAAFRYMTTGKHIGKVMIEIRKEQTNFVAPQTKFSCLPRYHCDPDKTYIICGGLGGFGLELADWLVLRGCKNLVLTSRTGIKTGYQSYRTSIWSSYGCTLKIALDDITTYKGCLDLIKSSNALGPVHAIFNLAVVLRDSIFENQSEESFKISFGPKANATQHLDTITRDLCPQLRDFVVFSSVSCGRGNAGQSNYGMSNSVMERICEKRRLEGLPALAIEWGAVGEVGLVADMQEDAIEMEIGGTLQQRISNCLEVMDNLLRQNDACIVSSIVVAEKKSRIGGSDSVVDAVAIILGIKDIKSISLQATLAEIGMDSMTAVEIKQTLEREYDVFLTPQDIKTMNFAKLIEIQTERDIEKQAGVKKERALAGMDMLLRMVPDEVTANTQVMPIQGKPGSTISDPTVIVFPGIEGLISVVEPLYKNITANLLGLQFPNNQQRDTIEGMAEVLVPVIEENISKDVPFKMVCYSYGTLIALEAIKILEQKGYYGTAICIDGAPNYLKALTKMLEVESDDKLQVSLLVHLATLQHPYEVIAKHVEALLKCDTFDDKINLAQSVVPNSISQTPEHQKQCAISLYMRLKALVKWNPEIKLKSKLYLFKPSLVSIETPDEISGLSSMCETPVEVRVFEGNHASVLSNPELSQAVNETLGLVVPSEEKEDKC